MSCDVGEVTERLENELIHWRMSCDVGKATEGWRMSFRCFTYVTDHSPTLLCFSYVTGSSLTSPGEPPMVFIGSQVLDCSLSSLSPRLFIHASFLCISSSYLVLPFFFFVSGLQFKISSILLSFCILLHVQISITYSFNRVQHTSLNDSNFS